MSQIVDKSNTNVALPAVNPSPATSNAQPNASTNSKINE